MNMLTIEIVADRLYMKPSNVRRLIRRGAMKGVKIGRRWLVDENDMRAFIESRRSGDKA